MAQASFGQLVDPQEEAIQRQRQYAQALRQQAMQPMEQQVVSGRVVPFSPMQGLANMLKAYAGRKGEEDADTKAMELGTRKRTQGAAELQGIVEALRGKPAIPSYQTGANEMGDESVMQNPVAAQAPDQNKALAMALASQNPMAQQIGGTLLTASLPKAPKMERVEVPDGKGGKRVGFVDMNSPNPFSTFQEGGVDPAKGIAVNGTITSPYAMGTTVPKQLDPTDPRKDLLLPDGAGGFKPNAPLIGVKKDVAKAGASNVSLSANTANKPFLSEIGKGVGEQVVNDFSGARAAQQVLNNVTQIEGALKNVIAGPAAGARIKLSQIGEVLGVNGADATEQLQNTRQVMQGLARQEMAAAAGMKGQGQITESERAILRKAESGNIDEITVPEMKTLLGALRKTSQYRMNVHNENMGRLRKDPNAAGVVDYMSLPSAGPSGGGSVIDAADAILRGGK